MSKKISIHRGNDEIVGLIDKPDGDVSFPTIILCHGFKGYKGDERLKNLAKALSIKGFAVFRFDFTDGIGESSGDFMKVKISSRVRDLKDIIEFVSNYKGIDSDRIGLCGYSMGGLVCILGAFDNKKIKAMALISSVYQVPETFKKYLDHGGNVKRVYIDHLKKHYHVNADFFKELPSLNSKIAAKKIRVPTLVIHGEKDAIVDSAQARLLNNDIGSDHKNYEILKDCDHKYTGEVCMITMVSEVSSFFYNHLF